jgi:hypothetical protein
VCGHAQQGQRTRLTQPSTIVSRVYVLPDVTHQRLELAGVVWEAAVVGISLGDGHPKEHIRDKDADFDGTCKTSKLFIQRELLDSPAPTESSVDIERDCGVHDVSSCS